MAGFAEFVGELSDDEDFLELIDVAMHRRRPRTFRERENNFEKYDDLEFKKRYRLSKNVTYFLIHEISNEISSKTNRNHALSPSEMVLITLRFLATGSYIKLVADHIGVDEASAITKVILAIARLRPQIINMPATAEERNEVRQGFYNIARFPRCLGALDCTHVKIQSPGGPQAEIYRNRKGFFSVNIQAVCNADLKILDIVARWPGSVHDANIFANSRMKHRFESGEFDDGLLVGDKGYGIKPYLITPLRIVETPAQNLFNESQIRTRNPIERCFGALKRRFPILALGIRLKIEKVEAIVVACAVLHNIAYLMKDDIPDDVNEEIEEEIAAAMLEDIVEEDVRIDNINNVVRETLINQYFQNLLI